MGHEGCQRTPKERPLTHDLLAAVLRALDAKVDRVVVHDFKGDTYFARLVICVENGTQPKKLIELDARPSDCIALAARQGAPIYVSRELWERVQDVSETLRRRQGEGFKESSDDPHS